MSKLCFIQGCPGNTRNKRRGEKIYYFKALEDQLEEWDRVIPGNDKLKLHDRICSRHFNDEDLIKEWNFVINDKSVTMPRGRWTLRIGAIPAKFDNYGEDLIRKSRERKSRPTSLVELGGSSSSDEFEEPHRKRPKKPGGTRFPKVAKKDVENVPKTTETGSKPLTPSTETPSKEPDGKTTVRAVDVTWEKDCDNFVNQLNTICSPTPADNSDAKPAKRGRGRPRKHPKIMPVKEKRGRGRPRKDQRPSFVLQPPAAPRHSTMLKRGRSFSSGGTTDPETENSVTVEQFVASGSEDTDPQISYDPQCPSEADARPAKRRPGRPRKKRKPSLVPQIYFEQSAATDCEGDVEILNDPDPSSHISSEFQIPTQVTVKTEKCDSGYENCDSVGNNHAEHCSVTSASEDSALQNYEGVVVKREICECKGDDTECYDPQRDSHPTILELPSTPIPCEETDRPFEEPQIDCEVISPVPEITRNEPECKTPEPEISIIPFAVSNLTLGPPITLRTTPEVNFQPMPTPHTESTAQGSQVTSTDNTNEIMVMSESLIDSTDHTTPCTKGSTHRPTPTTVHEELALQTKAPEINVEGKLPQTSKNQEHVNVSSDLETDFQGFSSGEDEDLVLKRKCYQNSAEMAAKSTRLYFIKLNKVRNSVASKPQLENGQLSPRTRRRTGRERRSSAEIAIDQLNELEAMEPVCSKKPAIDKNHAGVKVSALNTQEPSVQEGKFNKSDTLEERLAHDFRCDEALKCGRISDEVTVTKAATSSQRLDTVSNSSQGLDKVTSSSNHPLLSNKWSLKTHSSNQSSKVGHILNKVTTPSNHGLRTDRMITSSKHGLIKDKVAVPSNYDLRKDGMTTSSNPCKDKVTAYSNHHLLKNKVTISSHRDMYKDVGTSTSENCPLKDKIPTTYGGQANDRLAHLLNGSPLDRILQSSKGSPLLDSVTSTSICDPTVDKTSLILKNFKSDGVLALECVVLKEQVRQLQKELFLHKQMLIDSEHNASLLQRRLELQAQLPCAKCVNFKRGFIGKETLI